MPECVEVLLMCRELNKLMKNTLITKIESSKAALSDKFIEEFPMYCVNVETNGKLLWFEFSKTIGDTNKWYLFNNLGLRGGWMYNDKDKTIDISYIDSSTIEKHLYFKDSIYSYIRVLNTQDDGSEIKKIISSRGVDVCKQKIDVDIIDKQLKRIRKPIEILQFLMKQEYLSGIGNFYKAEILYRARISPHKMTSSLTKEEKDILCDSINNVIEEAITKKGRLTKYSDLLGYDIEQYEGCVYQKETDSFGNKVLCENTLDKRKTYWVPAIQK